MKPLPANGRQFLLTAVFVGLATGVAPLRAQPATADQGTNEIRIVQVQGMVEVSTPGATDWVRTTTNQILRPHYKLRTGPDSRATLLWSSKSAASRNDFGRARNWEST